MEQPVSAIRNDVLLGQHFQAICKRLKQAKRTAPVRPDSILHSGKPFALQQGGQRKKGGKQNKNRTDRKENGGERLPRIRRLVYDGALCMNKKLIRRVDHWRAS